MEKSRLLDEMDMDVTSIDGVLITNTTLKQDS